MADENKITSLTIRISEDEAEKYRAMALKYNMSQGDLLSLLMSYKKDAQKISLLLVHKNEFTNKDIPPKKYEFNGYNLYFTSNTYTGNDEIFRELSRVFNIPAAHTYRETTYSLNIYKRKEDNKFLLYEEITSLKYKKATCDVIINRLQILDNPEDISSHISAFVDTNTYYEILLLTVDEIKDESELDAYL